MAQLNPAKLLEEYGKKGYNILTPSVSLDGLGENWVATIKTVNLSPDPNDGDVYLNKADAKKKPEDKRYIVKKQGLDRLATLANVIWHEGRGSHRTDDTKDKNYISMEAFGAIRLADGTLAPCVGSYDMDLEAKEEDLTYEYTQKGKDYNKTGQVLKDYVEYCVGREIRRLRNHKRTLCESGARNRVIRALLGIRLYKAAELKKPFVCVSIRYQPDETDPEVKRLLTLASIGSMSQLYGMPAAAPAALPPPDQAEYVPVNQESENGTDSPEHEYDADGVIEEDELDGPEEDLGDHDFENWDRPSQIKHIQNLSVQKNYGLKALLERMEESSGIKGLDEFSDIQIISLFDKLNDKPDDDIPF